MSREGRGFNSRRARHYLGSEPALLLKGTPTNANVEKGGSHRMENGAVRKSEYASLLEDKGIKRWYDNLRRGSEVTADVYLRRLGHLCKDL